MNWGHWVSSWCIWLIHNAPSAVAAGSLMIDARSRYTFLSKGKNMKKHHGERNRATFHGAKTLRPACRQGMIPPFGQARRIRLPAEKDKTTANWAKRCPHFRGEGIKVKDLDVFVPKRVFFPWKMKDVISGDTWNYLKIGKLLVEDPPACGICRAFVEEHLWTPAPIRYPPETNQCHSNVFSSNFP